MRGIRIKMDILMSSLMEMPFFYPDSAERGIAPRISNLSSDRSGKACAEQAGLRIPAAIPRIAIFNNSY
jgi:hypothetical protein